MGKAAAVPDSRPWVKYLILLYATLFLPAVNGCCRYRTAADKQQSNPQQKIGVISRLRRLVGAGFDGAAGQLCRYGIGLLDFLCCRSVLVILLATGAIPVFDIALGSLGRRHCREVFQIRVVVCIQLSVAFATELTLCLVLAGRFPAGVLSQLLAAIITLVVFVIVCTLADYIIADITFVVFVCIDAILRLRACRASVNGAGAGMGAVFVGRPSAPVVVQCIAREEGRLIRRTLGAQTADCAGLVVDRLFRAGRGGFQIPLLGGFCREVVRRQLAILSLAYLADGFCGAGRRAAVAILGFRVRCIVRAYAGVRAVPVGCPRAIVMAERFAIGKGFRALRAAGGAGLIIYRRACAGGGGLQPVFVHLIDKMVRAKLAVRVLADLAEGRGKTVGRAALMRAAIHLQMAAGVESPMAVGIGLPRARIFGVPVRILVPACKGRLAVRALGGQHADLAGLVVERGRNAVCLLVQKRRDRELSREVVLGHFDAAGVAEMVAVRVGVVEPLSLSAADDAGLPVTVLIRAPVAVGAAGRFNMAGIVGADALVCALPVGHPRAPVMAERLSGREGRLVGGSLGAGTADGAGLVIHRLFGAGRDGFQIHFFGLFRREAVCFQRAIGLAAVVADSLFRAGRRTAGMLADGDILGSAEAVALRRHGRGDKPEAGFSRYVGSGMDRPRAEAIDRGDGFAVAREGELIAVGGIRAALRQKEGKLEILRAADGIRCGDGQGGNIRLFDLVAAKFAFAPILAVSCLPFVGMGRMDGHGERRGIARLVRGDDGLRGSRVGEGDLTLFVGGHWRAVDRHGVQIPIGHGEGLVALAAENVAALRTGDRRCGFVDDDFLRAYNAVASKELRPQLCIDHIGLSLLQIQRCRIEGAGISIVIVPAAKKDIRS